MAVIILEAGYEASKTMPSYMLTPNGRVLKGEDKQVNKRVSTSYLQLRNTLLEYEAR